MYKLLFIILLVASTAFAGPQQGSQPIVNHNDLQQKQGGTSGEYYHLTLSKYNDLTVFIDTDTTYYVTKTGNDTTGTGAVGAPWLTIEKAIDYVSHVKLNQNASVTVSIGAGTYDLAASTYFAFPYERIIFQGSAATTFNLTSVESSSGSAGAWSIVLNVSSVTGLAVNDVVGIYGAANGTRPLLLNGCFLITDVDVGNTRITIKSYNNYTSAPSGAVTGTCNVFKTKIVATSDPGFLVRLYNNISFKNLSFYSASGMDLIYVERANFDNVFIYSDSTSGNPVVITNICVLSGNNFMVSGGDIGIYIRPAGGIKHIYLATPSVYINGSTTDGVLVESGKLDPYNFYVTGCAYGIKCEYSRVAIENNGYFTGNTTYGKYFTHGSFGYIKTDSSSLNGTDASPLEDVLGNYLSTWTTTAP